MTFQTDESGRSFYRPTAFFLSMRPGALDPELGAPTTHGFPVFMHEYTHYLQDTTTTYGVLSFLNLIDAAQDVMRLVDEAEEIPLPLAENPEAEGTWLTQQGKLLPIARPMEEWPSGLWAYSKHEEHTISVEFLGDGKGLPVVVGTFVDNSSGEEIQHAIGAREVKEAYALAVEWLHESGSEGELSPEQFEYHAVERVIHAYLGSQATLHHTVVLCHWALQSPLPGVELFRLLDQIQLDEAVDAEALYDQCRELALANGLEEALQRFHVSLDRIVNHRIESGDENGFITAAFKWYRDIAARGLRSLVDKDRRFPLDTFLCATSKELDSEEASREWAALLHEFPAPLVHDQAHGGCFSYGPAEDQPAFFARALSDLVSRLRWRDDVEWACPLRGECKSSLKDDDCERIPWRKGQARPSCPYGAAAVYLHVESKTFTAGA